MNTRDPRIELSELRETLSYMFADDTIHIVEEHNVQRKMAIWSPQRTGAFLVIWTLLWPLYIIMIFPANSIHVFIYATLWGYIPGYPFWNSPFGIDALLTLTMLPFSSPGLLIAYFAYRTTKNDDISKGQYFLAMVVLQIIHMAIIWLILPCTISSNPVICFPAPVTGLLAIPFASKLDRLAKPWKEETGDRTTGISGAE